MFSFLKIIKNRAIIQFISFFSINSYFPSILKKTIYQGKLKTLCLPVLNCYSCPLAVTSCPIGGLQNFFAITISNIKSGTIAFGQYIIGILILGGITTGRFSCGWICPFGIIQDIINKIPIKKHKIPKSFLNLKYIVLILFVILLPLLVLDNFGTGETWFCKYICAAGTLEGGIPLVLMDENLKSQIGQERMFYYPIIDKLPFSKRVNSVISSLYVWKLTILVLLIIGLLFYNRLFCRVLCPLGALLALFNKISIYQMHVEEKKCIKCNKCYKTCPMDIKIYEEPTSMECIRCLKCEIVCPVNIISHDLKLNIKKWSEIQTRKT